MKNLAHQTYEEFRLQDRQRILAANPTIDQLIADYSYYRFCWAVNQACRVAGGKGKKKRYQPQMDYLMDALHELQRLNRDANLPNLKQWVEKDNPHQIFTSYRLGKAVHQFNLLIASKSADTKP
jgi:hypothetical protein